MAFKNLTLVLFSLLLINLSACGGKSSEENKNFEADYLSISGVCYRISDSAQMDTSLCDSTTEYYRSDSLCYKKSDGQQVDSSLCPTATSAYYLSNNLCYRSADNLQVDYSLCSSITSTTSEYYLLNNSCYRRSDNTFVAVTYCSGTTANTSLACSGWHYWQDQSTGAYQQVYCDGNTTNGNCSGYTLLSSTTNVQTTCL